MHDCSFCKQASRGYVPSRPVDLPLTGTTSFVSWASLGALVEGWVLVVPRHHFLNLGALPDEQIGKFEEFVSGTRDLVATAYNSPVYQFEHGGTTPGSAVGCSVDHAHMHIVPTSLDLLRLAKMHASHLRWLPVEGPSEARSICSDGESYLYLKQPDGRSYATVGTELPSQFFRQIIAKELDLGEPYWRIDERIHTSNQTAWTLLRAAGSADHARASAT